MLQFFDGGARRNPGPAGCGAAVLPTDGAAHPLATRSAYLGTATSNEAEYQGLILGLQLALDHGATEISICGDSKLVVNQLLGRWQVRNERLARLLDVINTSLLPRFDRWKVKHVYREDNSLADRLANQAMDAGMRGERADVPSRRESRVHD